MKKALTYLSFSYLLVIAGCGLDSKKDYGVNTHGGSSFSVNALDIYRTSVQPYLITTCGGCHSQNNIPLFAVSDSQTSLDRATPYINYQSPGSSFLVAQSKNGHCGGDLGCHTDGLELTQQIAFFYETALKETGPTTPPAVEGFVASSSFAFHTQELAVPSAVFSGSTFQTVSWDLSAVSPFLNGATLQADIKQFDQTTYLISNPRINNGSHAVHLKGVKILLNGTYNLANNQYVSIDKNLTPGASVVLSAAQAIIAKGNGLGDVFGFAFDIVE
jgi:hypothetical protein